MALLVDVAVVAGSLAWIGLLAAPWFPWLTHEQLSAVGSETEDLQSVTVLIPARNEASVLRRTLESVLHQGPGIRVIVVDDQSTDGTREIAESMGSSVTVVSGQSLPEGWSGKLWALEQGMRSVSTPLLLLIDADIELKPGVVAAALAKMRSDSRDFVSLMAHLRMVTFWEKLLIPAFIYFFKLLYPFRLGNSPRSSMAVAAGGFIFMRTEVLRSIGGFSALHGALIDDCTLARSVKTAGFRTWTGLSRSVASHREYPRLSDSWAMVARTAFTFLRYSTPLLILCTAIMVSMFVMVPLSPIVASGAKSVGIAGLAAMLISYAPTILYYRLNPVWILTLPVSGVLYLAMTWSSALRYWQGRRSEWKGRVYRSVP